MKSEYEKMRKNQDLDIKKKSRNDKNEMRSPELKQKFTDMFQI